MFFKDKEDKPKITVNVSVIEDYKEEIHTLKNKITMLEDEKRRFVANLLDVARTMPVFVDPLRMNVVAVERNIKPNAPAYTTITYKNKVGDLQEFYLEINDDIHKKLVADVTQKIETRKQGPLEY